MRYDEAIMQALRNRGPSTYVEVCKEISSWGTPCSMGSLYSAMLSLQRYGMVSREGPRQYPVWSVVE